MAPRNPSPPVTLTIAGTDPSGGAGIQADLKTFTALQCYGTSVITALTAQNTTGVTGVFPTPPDFIKQQIKAVVSDMKIGAMKTGMLFDAANTHAVTSSLKEFYGEQLPALVVDPVCVSTSGHSLLHPEAVDVMMKELFPLATLITPNKSEAELLLATSQKKEKEEIRTVQDAIAAAQKLSEIASCDVLLKGGHLTVVAKELPAADERTSLEWDLGPGHNMEILRTRSSRADAQLVIDILYERKPALYTVFVRPRIDSSSTHGTGCTLSAAIACYLAKGYNVKEAVKQGAAYTHLGIQTAFPIGSGHGPLNHLHSFVPRAIPPPTGADPYPFTRALIRSNFDVWKQYVEHPFVRQLGEGTLRRESFLHFIKQDYQYLKYYSRAYGLLVAKSRHFNDIRPAADNIQSVIREVSMHKAFCASFGITEAELESTPESSATTAYGAYLLDSGLHGDETKLIVTLAACLLGYGEVGFWLKSEAEKPNTWVRWDGNPYLKWMEDYSGAQYQNAVRSGLDILEFVALQDPPSAKRFEEWKEVWGKCTLLEKRFWDVAMDLS